MWTILKPREYKVEGVSLLYLKLFVDRKLSHFGGELQSEKSPRLFYSKILDYFQTGSFIFIQKYTQFPQFLNSELF